MQTKTGTERLNDVTTEILGRVVHNEPLHSRWHRTYLTLGRLWMEAVKNERGTDESRQALAHLAADAGERALEARAGL